MSAELDTQALLAQLYAMRATIDASIILLTGATIPEQTPTGCEHPATARIDLNTMGSGLEEHWSCKLCGHEERR